MYLSTTNFAANVKELYWTQDLTTESGYGFLLNILSDLGLENVQAIKSLTIICNDPHSTPRASMTAHPGGMNLDLITLWNKFMPELLVRGLEPH